MATTSTPFTEAMKAEFLAEESKDSHFLQLTSAIGTLGSDCSYNHNGFLIRVTLVDEAIQELVPRPLQARLLHAYHYLRLVGHHVGRSKFDTMRR